MSSFYDFYRQELGHLRKRASDFAQSHPALAGMLGESSTDPDVERLLEGVAFLTADIRRSAEDEFGEIVHDLAQTVCPQLLQPMPSATIIAFSPKPNLKQTHSVAAGTRLESQPVDGEVCHFETSWDTPVVPLGIASVTRPDLDRQEADTDDQVRIAVELSSGDTPLNNIEMDTLRIYVAGEFSEAADLYMLLLHYLRGLQLSEAGSGVITELPLEAVRPLGFRAGEGLVERPGSVLPGFGCLEDYFVFSEKFLFLEIDLGQWRQRGGGNRVTLEFVCDQPPYTVPPVDGRRFVLNATPATNTFEVESDPVIMDHRETEYALRPRTGVGERVQVKSVRKLEGIARGASSRREFKPFSAFVSGDKQGPVYQVRSYRSPGDGGDEVFVSIALPPEGSFQYREALKATLVCTNGEVPQALLPGDITTPTADTPELVSFTNVTAPSQARKPLMDERQLWHLVSYLALNYLSLVDVDNLKSMLRQYAVRSGDQRARDMPNLKRIDSLMKVQVTPGERIVGECFVRGQVVRVRMRNDHFSGYGDRFVFGNVLSYFFSNFAALNTYTELQFEDNATGERLNWAPRFGERQLM